MDMYGREKAWRLIVTQMFRGRQRREDPINRVTPESIRDEFIVLARASNGKVTESEAMELAALVSTELNAELEQFLETVRRVGVKLAPGRHSID
jgi:hypothetical protein